MQDVRVYALDSVLSDQLIEAGRETNTKGAHQSDRVSQLFRSMETVVEKKAWNEGV